MLPALLGSLPIGNVTLDHPVAGIDQLDNVDDLLKRHDGKRDTRNHPRPEAINLVRPSHLESTGAPWAGEQAGRGRMRGATGLHGTRLGSFDRLQERGGESRGREGKQVETDKESLIKGAADEQHSLNDGISLVISSKK